MDFIDRIRVFPSHEPLSSNPGISDPRLFPGIEMLTQASREADFPSLNDRTYLNTAAEGIPPRAVIDTLSQYAQDKLLGMDGRKLHEDQWNSARERIARAFGLTPGEIGICSCSSEAYNLAAMALQLKSGDEVVINDLDFPAGATPWLQSTCPAEVKVWRSREGGLRIEDLIPLLGAKTRFPDRFSSEFLQRIQDSPARNPQGSQTTIPSPGRGRRHPGTGSDPSRSVRCGPDHQLHPQMDTRHPRRRACRRPRCAKNPVDSPGRGWFNLKDPFREERFDQAESQPGAPSFTVGMPNYAAVYAINGALDYIHSVGVSAIDAYASALVRVCLEGLKKLPVEILTPDEPEAIAGILAFRHPDADRIHRVLHAKKIHIMSHAGRLRIAIHGYNTHEDIERLLDSLREAMNHS